MTTQKIALITGGSRGLGKDMAIRLAEKGTDIIITYQSKKELAAAVVEAIEAMGRKAIALPLNTSDISSLSGFLSEVKEKLRTTWGVEKFDFLINNAGMGATIPFEQVSEAVFDQFMNVHFKSVYFLTQQSLPILNDGGRIINISSGTTRFCVPGYSMYATMKGAVEILTKYLAKDLGARGITVNVVAPGPIETDFNNAAIRNNPDRKEAMASMIALGRVGQAEDIGGIIAFLGSPDGGWITGQRIEASGGVAL